MSVDLIIKGGVDVEGHPLEIAIHQGKIVEMAPQLEGTAKIQFQLESGSIISPGWIDAHTHCYEVMDLYYDFPDEIGVDSGVTTVIDAGSSGEANVEDFYKHAQKAKTNVYALLNISKNGIVTQDELANLANIDNDKNEERIKEYPDFIIGIKARMSKSVVGDNDTIPLKMAKELQHRFKQLPLMVHIGSRPPSLDDVLEICEPGDIITHCYNGKENGIIDSKGKVKPFVWDAYHRGILFDIGHGTDSFNFNVAHHAFDEGLLCNTISSDIYYRNRMNGPVFNLATTMDKGLEIGLSLKQVIDMVTIHPAQMYYLDSKGRLEVGCDGDLTIFKLETKGIKLTDSDNDSRVSKQVITPTHTVLNGSIRKVEIAK